MMTVKEIRKITGLSQARFSKMYDIPRRTIEDWERGISTPPAYLINLLERAVKEDFNVRKDNDMTINIKDYVAPFYKTENLDEKNLFYAVQENPADEWDVGSEDLAEALEDLRRQGCGLIAIIEEDEEGTTFCIGEIEYDDVFDAHQNVLTEDEKEAREAVREMDVEALAREWDALQADSLQHREYSHIDAGMWLGWILEELEKKDPDGYNRYQHEYDHTKPMILYFTDEDDSAGFPPRRLSQKDFEETLLTAIELDKK